MKFLKKASLAVSIAAVSFAANAELVAMDEATMSAATGQAGIDLNVNLSGTDAISVGSVVYTDEGSLTISDIALGAADGGEVNINNVIDVNAAGDLTIATTTDADLLLTVGSVDLSGGANLLKDLSLSMSLGAATTTISAAAAGDVDGVAEGNTKIVSSGTVEITDGSVDLLDGNIGVTGIKMYNGTAGTGVTVNSTMWADANALNIKTGFTGTIELGGIELGGTSIGSVAINNLSMTGATIQISGH
ncbi:MAG: hypothetical protein KBT77_12545 [Thalassolituus oleivorans]|uniref:DUF6160 family protein n=1 Tax=Thalassolituus oleivorans TaxID=187493 RepID=UPI001B6D5983|nr:DUF6160 family protein [Thalassolituus oleivorans]MBQ0728165.1 hypothetical protein [Thalassolituus oleivorans]MBQ0781187.1 hypothetical protein [Thalassolituus oleivorans]